MATTSTLHEADLEFRNEVISKLLDSVDCAKHMKDSFGQFLGSITADANHKHLAYHLFCIVTLYISKQTTLDEEQMSVLCRIIEQLRQEWGDGDASSETSAASLYTKNDDVCSKQSASPSTAALPRTEAGGTMNFAAKSVVSGEANNICEALQNISIARSTTPDSFVREAEKCILTSPSFHGAVGSKDTADLESQYPFGYRLMTEQGWSGQSGLGADGSGIQRPLDAYTLSRVFKDHESPVGLGYALNAGKKVPTNGNSTGESKKQTNGFAGASTAWNQYVTDPRTGDETAKSGYNYEAAINAPRGTRVDYGKRIQTKGKTKTIVQDQCVINDNWKDTSNYASTPQAQKNMSQGISGKTPKTPSINPGGL
ncbi:hypothetical protein F4824DRAFT_493174 [Ustulina deusta]|nr:hypothetical protein F4824DRAFT_493174 [Ustulina deusta]